MVQNFHFIFFTANYPVLQNLREGWQWSSPDFSSGSGNVQPDPCGHALNIFMALLHSFLFRLF
jgi:hypothetical protein